jgi:hypothetical protein
MRPQQNREEQGVIARLKMFLTQRLTSARNEQTVALLFW